jgi:hypothetical protein
MSGDTGEFFRLAATANASEPVMSHRPVRSTRDLLKVTSLPLYRR